MDREHAERLTKALADEGKLIEAGWVVFRLLCIPDNADASQLDSMRLAFMAGAQHLFVSIISMFDPDTQETAADLGRMDMINKELNAVADELKLRVSATKGSA